MSNTYTEHTENGFITYCEYVLMNKRCKHDRMSMFEVRESVLSGITDVSFTVVDFLKFN